MGGGTLVGGPCCWGPRSWGNRVTQGLGPPRRWVLAARPPRGGSGLRSLTEPQRERRPREPGRCGQRAAAREGNGEPAGRNGRTRGSGPALIPGSPRGAPSLPVRRRRRARLRCDHGQVQEPHHAQPVDPKFLRNMRFAKKHNKKGLKKMQANNAKQAAQQAALQKKD
ncbi:hypothetical protein DV515_00009643 [Chloebia gouldiae]|uniref:Large ribosomal subunit protein eL29 n=1 Tax=Chloebia gouldiae TaxID=44316 RepID=A0A3L8SAY7_CHLGU|nr:hypothetical protein DV515_00009643 [Chloebia gouldiae]